MCRKRKALFLAELFVLLSGLVFSMPVSIEAELTKGESVAPASTMTMYQINASRDDAWGKVFDVKWDDVSYYLSKSDMIAGCRWKINIPKGAIIEQAYFICKARSDSEFGARIRIQVFDQDSCDDFDVIFWDWPVMPERVDWNLPIFTTDDGYFSPDLKTIIQEYVDRPGYNVGNYLGLKFVWQAGLQPGHEVWAWDGDPNAAARLGITYSLAPVANFIFSPQASIVEEITTFDASTSYDLDGFIVNYKWDFGDGNITTLTEPLITHIYASIGTHNVTLTVTDNDGLTDSEFKLITVRKYPVAFFTYSPPAPVTNQIVTFNASLSTPEGGNIINYTWDFGDGNVTTVIDPIINHTYATAGQYNVTLVVTDSEGLSNPTSKIVKIRNPGYPVAIFTHEPAAPIVNEMITFNASGSYDPDGNIVNYTWDFGDGTNATGMIVIHNYTAARIYNVTLIIIDNEGLNDSASRMVTVFIHDVTIIDVMPPANEVHVGQVVNITVIVKNEGTAIETFIVTLYYSLTPINTKIVFNMVPGTQTNLTFSWNTTGVSPGFNYTIKAEASTVTGETETADNTYINGEIKIVKNPVAFFTYSPDVPIANKAVTLDALLSTPEGGAIVSYFWDFGDRTNGTGVTVTHIYTDEGNYTVVLTVIDSEGLNDTESKTINIREAPIAEFTYLPKAPIIGEIVSFNASLSYDPDGTIISYFWSFGDDSNGTGIVVTYAYASAGTFNVTLTVTDNDGCVNFTSKEITVYIHDIKIVSVTLSATEVLLGQTLNITVITKNEGTTVETFNVTLYYNNTAIETQTVVNLVPDAQIILTFRWNTTGIEDDSIYAIKAEAEAVAGETDNSDNTYIGGDIKVSSQLINPGDTAGVLPYVKYVIPIGLTLMGFLAAGFIWKKRGTSPKCTGFEFFDEMTADGIPDGYSVMIIGRAGSGKSMLCQQLIYNYLTKGKKCVYVTYDSFPDEVRKNMKNFHWVTSKYERNEDFKFVDCYSQIAGVTSREEYHTEQPFSLSELSILISAAMGEGEGRARSTRVFLDSTAPLFTRLDPAQVINFMQDRGARIKGCEGIFFFTVGEGTVPARLMRRLDEIVDCIVELDVNEEKGKTLSKMRIKKLRGQKFVDTWIYFSIDVKKGILFSVPKDLPKIQTA